MPPATPVLPTYESFLTTLTPVAIPSFPEDSTCPICHEPFHALLPLLYASRDALTLSFFLYLPFALPHTTDLDVPVQLPCPRGHIIGLACLKMWFTTSSKRECLLCMTELFRHTGATLPRLAQKHLRQRWKHEKKRIEQEIPTREFVVDYRFPSWTTGPHINATNDNAEGEFLATMMLMSARLQRPKLPTYEDEPTDFNLKTRPGRDWLRVVFPRQIRGATGTWDTEEELSDDEFGDVDINRPDAMRYFVRKIAQGVSLDKEGRYPDWVVLMLRPEVEVMWKTVKGVLDGMAAGSTWSPAYLAERLIKAVKEEWAKSSEVFGPHDRRMLLLENSVYAWVGLRRRLAEAKMKIFGGAVDEGGEGSDDSMDDDDEEDDGDDDEVIWVREDEIMGMDEDEDGDRNDGDGDIELGTVEIGAARIVIRMGVEWELDGEEVESQGQRLEEVDDEEMEDDGNHWMNQVD